MSPSLLLLLSLASAPPSSFSVRGEVRDALHLQDGEGAGVWVSRTLRPGAREMVLLDEQGRALRTLPVPSGAVAVDACPGRGLLFSDARGVVDASGKRLIEGAVLLGVADPEALYAAPLCGREGDARGEVRVAVHGGLRLLANDGSLTTLPFRHRARAYSGSAHRGLRPSRPYAMALSLYAPHLLDADVNGDGRLDLVVVHEGRVGVFLRGPDGRVLERGSPVRDLGGPITQGDDGDVRVLAGDLDGDARADLVVSVTEGAVPERSSVHVLPADKLLNHRSAALLWKRSGLSAPLGLVSRARGKALVVAEVDTSLVALGAALFTGEAPLKVLLQEPGGKEPAVALELTAQIDVRGGRMAGAMPVVQVDFDGDGHEDLLDLGRPGKAALFSGTAGGFLREPTASWNVPRFSHVVPMPSLPGVVLIGAPEGASTQVTVLKGEKKRAARR